MIKNTIKYSILSIFIITSTNCFANSHSNNSSMDLAQASQNPIANLISVPIENDINYDIGKYDRTQDALTFKPVYPIPLRNKWTLVTRTLIPLYLPQPKIESKSGNKNGLSDINPQLYFVAPPIKDVMIGVGPTLIIPTATNKILGSGKWSIGPTGVIVWSPKNIVAGVLLSNVWSFAGQSHRANVNLLTLQLFFNYNFSKGWFIFSDPVITSNWKAPSGPKWTIPLGAGFGRLIKINKQNVKLNIALFKSVTRPITSPKWSLQGVATFLFPE